MSEGWIGVDLDGTLAEYLGWQGMGHIGEPIAPMVERVKAWLAQKYGKLNKETWRDDLKQGFDECFRVLEPGGFLIFKWNEDQVRVTEVNKLFPVQPLFGQKGGKTHWLVFMKEGAGE